MLIVANWKMHGSKQQVKRLKEVVASLITPNLSLIICPPYPYLDLVVSVGLTTGAQDCAAQVSGSYTGDVSAAMIADVGGRYVILGHSERRRNHAEDVPLIAAKIQQASNAGLTPIVC